MVSCYILILHPVVAGSLYFLHLQRAKQKHTRLLLSGLSYFYLNIEKELIFRSLGQGYYCNTIALCLLPPTQHHPCLPGAKPQLVKPPSNHRLCTNHSSRVWFSFFPKKDGLSKVIAVCKLSTPQGETE